MPKDLLSLLEWYEAAWWTEVMVALHGGGVWRDWGATGQGSALGAPRYSEDFRRYIEAARWADIPDLGRKPAWLVKDREGNLLLPLHAALANMALGTPRHQARPEAAKSLFRLAQHRFNWKIWGLELGVTLEQAEDLAEKRLRRLFDIYRELPKAGPSFRNLSDSQADAEATAR